MKRLASALNYRWCESFSLSGFVQLIATEEKGMLLLSCGTYDNTLRWIPPLNVTSEQVNNGLKIFGEALKEVAN